MKRKKSYIFKFIYRHRSDIFFISIIILFSLLIRLFLLDKIPTNLTGDESWDLSNVYRIVYGVDVYPLTLFGDGSVPAILYFPVALAIKFFGASLSIIFLRLNIVFYSVLSLIGFYLILKNETSKLVSFLFTVLLSSNYVFLNFSRTAWVNMASVFSGLFLILFIEKAIKDRKQNSYLIAGIFSGISFYSYHYGRILAISILIYLILRLVKSHFNKVLLKGIVIFSITSFIITLLFIIVTLAGSADSILRRPGATFAFSSTNILGASTTPTTVFWHQVDYTIRGFILFDGSVMSEGIENQRYVPLYTSPVNIVIGTLFWGGLIYFLIKRKYLIWWVVILSIFLTEFLSVFPPNFSRGLFYIPLIYFVSGVFTYKTLIYIVNSLSLKKSFDIIYVCLIIITFLIASGDINLYFSWMGQPYEYNARQPAISYEDFPKWQRYQINLIKEGQRPLVNQEWYLIRNRIE